MKAPMGRGETEFPGEPAFPKRFATNFGNEGGKSYWWRMKITSDVFDAYLKCPTKCWLRATGEPANGNTYAEWVEAQSESFRATETERLLAEFAEGELAR